MGVNILLDHPAQKALPVVGELHQQFDTKEDVFVTAGEFLNDSELNRVENSQMSSNKRRFSSWKNSFFNSSSRANTKCPGEFICPISMSLMSDPVIVSSGQTYERRCIEAWMELGRRHCHVHGMELDHSTVIPNVALRSAISNWCQAVGVQKPSPPDQATAKGFVERIVAKENWGSRESSECESRSYSEIGDLPSTPSSYAISPNSDPGLVKSAKNASVQKSQCSIEKIGPIDAGSSSTEKLADPLHHLSLKPTVKFSHSATELSMQQTSLDSSSSGDLCVPLPLATKPCSYSSQRHEIVEQQEATCSDSHPEIVGDFVLRLRQSQTLEQEKAVIDLRKLTRTNVESRISLCNPELLAALLPLLTSRYSVIQTNAVAALVNLSLENDNKVSIVRAGAIPCLIDVLKAGHPEAQEHAAGAIFSLALNDENKTAIGVLGAVPPLIHMLRSSEERTRQDAAMALYHLSFAQSNRSKLMKVGAISILLNLAQEEISGVATRALLILCNIAATSEGRKALLDANATASLVGILAKHQKDRSKGSQVLREHTVAALLSLSHNNLRFKSLAMQAGAMELLVGLTEDGNVRAKEKASALLSILRGVSDDEDGCPDSILTRSHRKRLGWGALSGPNSTEF
eukprot:Gb_16859 [translate_table: standard]